MEINMATASLCKVCISAASQYICPRCNLAYCSLSCYKKHDEECIDSFSCDNIRKALQNRKASRHGTAAMASILRAEMETTNDFYAARNHGSTSSDVSESSDTENAENIEHDDKLEKLALADKLNLEDLSQREKKLFLNAVESGHINGYVSAWRPWWDPVDINNANTTFADLAESLQRPLVHVEDDEAEDAPALPPDSLAFDFHGRAPNFKLLNDIISVILSYCYAAKSFNGQISGCEEELASAIVSLAAPLLDNDHVPPKNPETAARAFVERVSARLPKNKTLLFSVLRDGCVVLQRKGHVLRCLEHARRLVLGAGEAKKKAPKKIGEHGEWGNGGGKEAKKRLFLARKKIEFFIAWTKRYYDAGRFGEAAMVLGLQWQSLFGELRRMKEAEVGKNLRVLGR